MNKFRQRILSLVENMDAQIVLTEISDSRIQKATHKLESIGIKTLFYKNFIDKKEKYIDYISKLPFTNNWPSSNLNEYIDNPINFSLAMVACGDADGLVAGAITPVPGGVGPMTIACLLHNTLIATCRKNSLEIPKFF